MREWTKEERKRINKAKRIKKIKKSLFYNHLEITVIIISLLIGLGVVVPAHRMNFRNDSICPPKPVAVEKPIDITEFEQIKEFKPETAKQINEEEFKNLTKQVTEEIEKN